jgi:TRAP transporter TAXI family solute receptor
MVTRFGRCIAWLFAGLAVLALAGCARGPDEQQVVQAMQQQLDAAMGGQVLAIERLRLAGSASLKEPPGRLVYFNAQLRLARDYDFTRWTSHSVASLGALLGAGPKGLIGLNPDGNRVGDVIGVHGTAAFAQEGTGWRLVANPLTGESEPARPGPAASVAAVQPRPREAAPPTPSQLALERLSDLVGRPAPATMNPAEHERIVHEELEHAHAALSQRLARQQTRLVVAGGPAGGAYEETIDALAERAKRAGLTLEPIVTEGSVGNIRLLVDRTAQFALVQNDVARNALLGRGRFAGAPQPDLRAIASLFPEAVQLVVRADAGIATVADLRGKRVALGPEGSGSRSNALALLEANGLAVDLLAAADAVPVPDALAALGAGKLDAAFVTAHAPAPAIQRLAKSLRIAIVPIGPSKALVDAGLVPFTIPARTYPGQDAPVPTVAATALLVARADVPDAQVDALLDLLFVRREAAASASVAQIATRTAREGVTIPMLAAADRWLAAHGSPGDPAAAPAPAR